MDAASAASSTGAPVFPVMTLPALECPKLLPLVYAGIRFVDGVQQPVTPKEVAA
jgi:hypothetical protein